ncbi:YlcI/YnfO family protein [Enterobacter sp. JMULE2]|uniref:YlcI/YnfO family protein n=1 Tax=Enterobacter sp. JMULE2 TaxID=2518340 RepID=UPI0015765F54
MATPNKNAKSQLTTVRVPHDVMEGMEGVKQDGESNAGFIVTAMRGEIARRQLTQNGSEKVMSDLNSALDTLAHIEAASAKAGKELQEIVSSARQQLQQLRPGSEPPADSSPAPDTRTTKPRLMR